MSNQLYKNFPTIQYTLNTGKVVTIKDFFRKASIEKSAVDSVIEYQYYEILDGERPDIIASKLYGDGDLHWTFFLVNDFDNYYDWHMDMETFTTYMADKYQGQNLVATTTTDIVKTVDGVTTKFLLGETATSNVGGKSVDIVDINPIHKRLSVIGDTLVAGEIVTGSSSGASFTIASVTEHQDGVHHYVDSKTHMRTFGGDGWTPVTHFTEETEVNEKKRLIKVIRPNRMRRVIREFERIMSDE